MVEKLKGFLLLLCTMNIPQPQLSKEVEAWLFHTTHQHQLNHSTLLSFVFLSSIFKLIRNIQHVISTLKDLRTRRKNDEHHQIQRSNPKFVGVFSWLVEPWIFWVHFSSYDFYYLNPWKILNYNHWVWILINHRWR